MNRIWNFLFLSCIRETSHRTIKLSELEIHTFLTCNLTHRYHDRYFPEHFYHDDRNDYDDDEPERPAQVVRHQVSTTAAAVREIKS